MPADLVEVVREREEKVRLSTRDPAEAKSLFVLVAAEAEERWADLWRGVQALSHRQMVALAGEYYRQLLSRGEENPPPWEALALAWVQDEMARDFKLASDGCVRSPDGDAAVSVYAREAFELRCGEVGRFLTSKGICVSPESFGRLVKVVASGAAQAREQLLRYERGDYRKDPEADRFPAYEVIPAMSQCDAPDRPPEYYDLNEIYAQFAVDGEIEKGAIPQPTFPIQKEPVRPDLSRFQCSFCSDLSSRIPGGPAEPGRIKL